MYRTQNKASLFNISHVCEAVLGTKKREQWNTLFDFKCKIRAGLAVTVMDAESRVQVWCFLNATWWMLELVLEFPCWGADGGESLSLQEEDVQRLMLVLKINQVCVSLCNPEITCISIILEAY